MNKTIFIVLLVFLSVTLFASFASANEDKEPVHETKTAKKLGCKCSARSVLKCGLGKSDEANGCRKKYIQNCRVRCTLLKKCSAKIAEECSTKKVGSVDYKKCERYTAATFCVSEVDKSLIKGCKCKTFSRALCGNSNGKDFVRCRDNAYEACKERCEVKLCTEHKKRICISQANCSCRTIAKDKCATSEKYGACFNKELKSCSSKCKASTRCFPLSCKNAGFKRCEKAVAAVCEKVASDEEKHSECVSKKTERCRAYETATCKKARRLFKYRFECTEKAELRCGKLVGAEKCKCISNARQNCVTEKIRIRKVFIRHQKSCSTSAKLLCDEKKCENVKECYEEESKRCHRRHRRVREIVPPSCVDKVHKLCGNTEGRCFKRHIKRCKSHWLKRFCEHKSFKACDGDFECMKGEILKCKKSLPKCWAKKSLCNDNNKCTTDICHPKLGCTNVPKNCNDKNLCTKDHCDAELGCVHKAKDCNDDVECTVDTCNPKNGQCENKRVHSKCETEEDCTTGICSDKGCVYSTDNKNCIIDIPKCEDCVAESPCETVNCNIGEDLSVECVRKDKVCDDGKKCTVDFCDSETGKCIHRKIRTGECTGDSCETTDNCSSWGLRLKLHKDCKVGYCDSKLGVCVAVENKNRKCVPTQICEEKCKKRNACDVSSTCSKDENNNIICDRPVNPCDDGKKCTLDSCNEKTGSCEHKRIENTNECKHYCETDIDCSSWEIQQKLRQHCQESYCNKVDGTCVVRDLPNKQNCKCDIACQARNKCETAKCVGSPDGWKCEYTKLGCNDGDKCTSDLCDVALGCVHKLIDGCTECPVECLSTNKCEHARCVKDEAGKYTCKRSQKVCEDKNICTEDYCDAKLGCVHKFKKDCFPKCKEECKPRNKCETVDCVASNSAKGFECVYSTISCNDNDKCTVDQCDLVSGKCIHSLKGICESRCEENCNAKNKCSKCVQIGDSKEWKCVTSTTSCDDKDDCTTDYCDAKKGCVHKLIQSEKCKKCDENDDCADLNLSLKLYKTCQKSVCDETKKHCVVVDKKNKSKCIPPPPNCFPRNACESTTHYLTKNNKSICKRVVKTCNDGIDCTRDYCDTRTGICRHVAVNCFTCTRDSDCAALDAKVSKICKKATCDLKTNVCSIKNDNSRVCELCPKCVPNHACDTAECTFNKQGKPVCSHKSVTCDDGDVCTRDTCDVKQGCVHSKISGCCKNAKECPHKTCANNKDCTTWGEKKKLSDTCHEPVCNTELGKCVSIVSVDQSKCTNKPPPPPSCTNCKPANPCQTTKCVVGENNKATCDIQPISCDDNNKCTTDSCDSTTGVCVHTKLVTPECKICNKDSDCSSQASTCQYAYCDLAKHTCVVEDVKDVSKCTPPVCANCVAANACQQATCSFGDVNPSCSITTTVCNDNNACTDDYCDVQSGNCVHVAKPTDQCIPCEQKLDCAKWGSDNQLSVVCKEAVCDTENGVCVSRDLQDKSNCPNACHCEATSPCETAKCVTTKTNTQTCQITPKNCDDNNACTIDSCDKTTGNCVNTPNNLKCDDADICTVDTCDVKQGCVHSSVPPSPQCVPCSADKQCTQYAVTHNLANTCKESFCNSNKHCSSRPIPNKICAVPPKCECPANLCSSSTCTLDANNKPVCTYVKKSCDDGVVCTIDSCDAKTGLCVNTPKDKNTKVCTSYLNCVDWFNKLDIADKNCKQSICNNGCCKVTLKAGSPTCTVPKCPANINCKTSNPCLTAQCVLDQTLGYLCTTSPNPKACDDGNVCTKDTCDSVKGCVNTPIPGCIVCSKDSCQPSDLCHTSTLVTNVDGTCTCKVNQISCDDGVGCTTDSCNIATGKCQNVFTPGPQCTVPCTNTIQCFLWGHQQNLATKCKDAVCDTKQGTCIAQDDASCHKVCDICTPTSGCDSAKCVKISPGKYVCQHTPKDCNDHKTCTVDSCNVSGKCVNTYKCPTPQCNKDLDCVSWGQTQNLAASCSVPVCDITSGSCHAVANPDTSKCTQHCVQNTDCASSQFGSVCYNGNCQHNTCTFDSDCYAGIVPGKQWCYCEADTLTKASSCVCKPLCTTNECCNDGNPCTKDLVMPQYGFCKHISRCDDSNACTTDVCIPSADKNSFTCSHTSISCSSDCSLASLAISAVPDSQKVNWLGKCDKNVGCLTCCPSGTQCNDHNGCTFDTCPNGQCQNAPIDNQWCDPKIASQPITFQSIPGLRNQLALAGYDIAALGE